MVRVKIILDLSYLGTRFNGWQAQAKSAAALAPPAELAPPSLPGPCRLYNRGRCQKGDGCRSAHICSDCYRRGLRTFHALCEGLCPEDEDASVQETVDLALRRAWSSQNWRLKGPGGLVPSGRFIWCFFLGFFWLQLWTTFEWGGCREYNERTGTRDCMSPEFLYPVSGKVLAAVPSFAQGFAFELVSGLSKLSVDLIVSMQVWPSNEEMRCTAASYYFFLEVVGKLGFICVLGFLYVPDYGGDEMGCTGRLDFWFLGNWSFSCLKLNVPRTLRFQLFLASVKGPFLISGILGIFKKTLLPILLEKLRSLENLWWPLDYLVRCVIAVLRLLVLLLYCDWHARDAGGAASLRALLRLADDANDADAERRRALAEGRRRVFDPFEECIELLLHFLWVSCFFVVYPLGGLLAFGNQALELRCDTVKLLAARRRPWPRAAVAEKKWLPSCAQWIVHIAIVMNVLVLLLPFALAAQECGAVLVTENLCTLTTALTALAATVGFEVYWCFLRWFLRRCGRSKAAERTAGAHETINHIVPAPMEVKPKSMPSPRERCCEWFLKVF